MADTVQINYEELARIANRFGQEAANTRRMLQRTRSQANSLQQGGWEGRGAAAFFNEMERDVLPALNRLSQVLDAARDCSLQASQVYQRAEEEASRVFKTGVAGSGVAGEWEAKGKIWEYDYAKSPGKRGGFDPELKIQYGTKERALFGDPNKDGWSAFGGKGGFEAGLGKDGFSAGPFGEVYALKGKWDGVAGSENLGLSGGMGINALKGEGFIGIKDNSLGATIGGTLVSVEGETGVNVAGVNVGVTGEIGLKAELGLQIGPKTKIKLPFITLGFTIGGAKENEE